MEFEYPPDASPIDTGEAELLIPRHITTQKELNEWESLNIRSAREWIIHRKHRNIRTLGFIKELHKRMFDRTWEWAGKFRQSDKNIGVHWAAIPAEVKKFLDDMEYWIRNSLYSYQELAARAHYRLVWIHPFPNGNGRHARLYADALLVNNGLPPFEWGGASLNEIGEIRSKYIKALQSADRNDFIPLLEFLDIDIDKPRTGDH